MVVDASAPATGTPSDARPSWRGPGRGGLLVDVGIAAVLTGLITASTISQAQLVESMGEELGISAPSVFTYFGGAVMCLPLALRRRWPLTVLPVVASAFTVYGYTGGTDGLTASAAVFLAVLSAGSHGRSRWRDWVRGLVIAALMAMAIDAILRAGVSEVPLYLTWVGQGYMLVLNTAFFVAAWVLGDQLRLRWEREAVLAERTAQLAARTLELEAERERSERQATVAERLRIARELHDVLGHHVSVMGVQAAAARRVVDADPARAQGAMASIEGASRQAVTELQRVLKLLREDDEQQVIGALARLPDLLSELRHAGVAVAAQIDPPADLAVELDLAAVRVVQEALTNVLRHAGPGSSAWVRVTPDPGGRELLVEVGDDGRGTPPPELRDGDADGVARGSGLAGMRERVELHGGVFWAGRRAPRGWLVQARLPLSADEVRPESNPVAVASSRPREAS